MTDRRKAPAPPVKLSRWARGVWAGLLTANDFRAHELIVFWRALCWWDLSDRWLAESARAPVRDRGRLVRQARDAAQTALRYWRTLKFVDPEGPRPRIGRPSGPDWRGRANRRT